MSLPLQQKSLLLLGPRGPLTIQHCDVLKPSTGEILVQVEAAALNPADWKVWSVFDTSYLQEFPTVLGLDGAGVVRALGENVTGFEVGDRVAVQGTFKRNTGTFQQYLTTPAAFVIKLPECMSFDGAATLSIGIATVAVSLYNKHKDAENESIRLVAPWEGGGQLAYAGKPAVVLAGATSVGQYAIQFLKLSGFSPIITTASPRNTELLTSLGATHVLDRSSPTAALQAEIFALTGGPIEVIYDAVGVKETQHLAYDVVASRGSIVLAQRNCIDAVKMADGKQPKTVWARGVFSFPQNVAFSADFVKKLTQFLAEGSIKPNIPEVLPGGLNAVPGGLERLKAGAVSARKLVVRPNETS